MTGVLTWHLALGEHTADPPCLVQINLGGDRVLPLAYLRGRIRPVIVAGTPAFVSKALSEAEPYKRSLRDRGVSVVPLRLQAADPASSLASLKAEFKCGLHCTLASHWGPVRGGAVSACGASNICAGVAKEWSWAPVLLLSQAALFHAMNLEAIQAAQSMHVQGPAWDA